MSFLDDKELISEGDTVILYLSISSQYPLEVRKLVPNRSGHLVENKFQSIYGMLDIISLVGKKYGSKIHLPRGWGYLLRPSCELWTKNLPHRTQIIYTPDISMILMGLGLSPGATVVEAGTGSGSLSHSFIRTVHPSGHLFTYDFHEKRAQAASLEFKNHGLSNWVTVGHRDVVADGFDVAQRVDAVFLDLPCPWDVIPHVQRSLKRGGKLCTFSPCIEQVQKTYEALKGSGDFVQMRTQEVLQRQMSVQTKTLMSIDFSGGVSGAKNENDDSSKFRIAPVKKDPCKFKTLAVPNQTPGHTGYLTFATFIPDKMTS